MYYKVFISPKEIAFANTQLDGFCTAPNFTRPEDLLTFINGCEEDKIVVLDDDGKTWKAFKKHHVLIKAAGGLVKNEQGDLLVIKRLGYWDLPKGKIELGESIPIAAEREVKEECGITKGLTLLDKLPDTYHTYQHKGQNVLKQTHWFFMRYSGYDILSPQLEEGITEVCFMPKKEVENVAMKNTYKSLLPLFNAYLGRNK